MPFETCAAFSGDLICPRCEASLTVYRGRLASFSRSSGLEPSAGPSTREAAAAPRAFAQEFAAVSLSGAVCGLLIALLGFFSCDEMFFLAPAGLLVAMISVFTGVRYRCSACGARLSGASARLCPKCKSPLVSSGSGLDR
jgi:hypothetical protein